MRKIDMIVIHCSATRADVPLSPRQLEEMHRQRGFDGCGYHYYVRRDGEICTMRPVDRPGAHAKGYNQHSIGVCYEGGLDEEGKPKDTRTDAQKAALAGLVRELKLRFPRALVVGHRDLEPMKDCPCFEAAREYRN